MSNILRGLERYDEDKASRLQAALVFYVHLFSSSIYLSITSIKWIFMYIIRVDIHTYKHRYR